MQANIEANVASSSLVVELKNIIPFSCDNEVDAFLKCTSENPQDLKECQKAFTAIRNCIYLDTIEDSEDTHDESTALGRACKRWMPPLFDPDNKDHNRDYSTVLGRFLMKYVPAIFDPRDEE